MDFRKFFDGMPDKEGILITNKDYEPLFVFGIAEILVEEDKITDSALSVLKKALKTEKIKLDSDQNHYLMHAQIINDGSDLYYALWIKDESENAETEKKLKYCLEVLDNINEGIIVTDKNGKIVIYNKKLGEFEDLDKNDVIGKQLKDVYDEWSAESSEHYQVLKTGQAIKEGSYKNITKLGRTNQLVASSFPIKIDGNTEAAYSISRNVTTIREIYNRTLGIQSEDAGNSVKLKNGTRFTFKDIIHKSKLMDKLISDAEKAALNDSPVLVYGETGTGKEMIVQGIHNSGSRRLFPFVALNCAALPETLLESLLFGTKKGAFTGAENTVGFFEQAGNGTLYLDEINSMPLNLQAKFLRAIQEKCYRRIGDVKECKINCKVISSVNVDPMKCVEDGQLRQDLYYRLSTIVLEIPPLRKRKEDILELVDYFGRTYCSIYGEKVIAIDDDLKKAFQSYDWPGNVRELEHLVERGISLLDNDETLTLYNMPSYLREKLYSSKYMPDEESSELTLNEILRIVEKKVIENALKKNNMNISKAARSLGIKRQNMQYRIDKLDLKKLIVKEID